MTKETPVARKRLGAGTTATLLYEDSPAHPRRDLSTLTTIVAWHPDRDLSDTDRYENPEDFDQSVLAPAQARSGAARVHVHETGGREPFITETGEAGVILGVHMQEHGNVALYARDQGYAWERGQLGWAYVTPGQMARHGLSREQAVDIIRNDLGVLEAYTNGSVYLMRLDRPGRDPEHMGNLYGPAGSTMDAGNMDNALEEMT